MPFRNREDAARLLSDRLERFKGQKTLVLGIPRGGVPMAAVVADRLDAEFDVMLVHKLRTPFQPELAFGSIDETGEVYLAPFAGDLAIDDDAVETEKRFQLSVLEKRRSRHSSARRSRLEAESRK